jgi:Ca2+-binding EF-hand superfamily protein
VTREFVDLARAGSSVDAAGEPVISRGACRSLFARIGIKSQRVADSLFDSFDEDGSGTISLKEFLHALVLVMRGGASEKLERVFDCIDLDHDGGLYTACGWHPLSAHPTYSQSTFSTLPLPPQASSANLR